MINKLQEPEFIMWVMILLIFLISRFGIGLDYISVEEIIKKHIDCFRNGKNGKILKVPFTNYIILPFFMDVSSTSFVFIVAAQIGRAHV